MSEYCDDDWPTMADGKAYDGMNLLDLVHNGESPFAGNWDVNLLIKEVEDILGAHVVDIPAVTYGIRNYGLHIKLSNSLDIIARLNRSDVNMPNFDGYPFELQLSDHNFETAVYTLLHSEPGIFVSKLLYHRVQIQHDPPRLVIPRDIIGRSLFLFEKSSGTDNVWHNLSQEHKTSLLSQLAHIRASLFNFNLPFNFAKDWFLDRLFEQKPNSLPVPFATTREFWLVVFSSKIEATIGNIGDMIGWESDNATVGPIAAAAKQSILRLIPHILPPDNDASSNSYSLYRPVLEHGDFGVHNVTVTTGEDDDGLPQITSLFDWETGCIVPALLSDPTVKVTVDLRLDENAGVSITRANDDTTPEELAEYASWGRQYYEALFDKVAGYEHAIRAGKDARHLWFALQAWRGEDPEGYFGKLGLWAEGRMRVLAEE